MSSPARRGNATTVPGRQNKPKDDVRWVLEAFWGKARSREPQHHPSHGLLQHSLDVAATASALIARMPRSVAALYQAHLGPQWRAALRLLSALHDLGKLAPGFQAMAPYACQTAAAAGGQVPFHGQGQGKWLYGGDLHHDALGVALWDRVLAPQLFPQRSQRRQRRRWRSLVIAACGHHGKPPAVAEALANYDYCIDRNAERAALVIFEEFTSIFGMRDLSKADIPEGTLGSYLVAAFVNVCDAIGSNESYFRYESRELMPRRYYRDVALPRARNAVKASGLLAARPLARQRFAELYPAIAEPTPLQRTLDTVPLKPGPQLWFVEDMTGAGKTEASHTLAARMLGRSFGYGIGVAMPSMATADAMFERERNVARLLYKHNDLSRPSTVVVHGASRRSLEEKGLHIFQGDEATFDRWAAIDKDYECTEWFSANNRQALSSQVTVATVDQYLMATMPVKFQALRFFGLLGKVLVVDEVHGYDGYTLGLLKGLLAFQGALGAPVILMSATLPSTSKRELTAAYAQGAGWAPEASLDPGLAEEAFPLVTEVREEGIRTYQPAVAPHARRQLPVRLSYDRGDTMDQVLEKAQAGECCLYICNTVQDAIDTARWFRSRHGDVSLIHSRFPANDLKVVKDRVFGRFGPASKGASRHGAIVVATSIVEASLDLDFDFLASDLCPMANLLQRLGRWRRHRRNASGDPIDPALSDGRPDSAAVVVSPDPRQVENAGWYDDFSKGASSIYPNTAVIWRTADLILEEEEIGYPGNVRQLVEKSCDVDEAPEVLSLRRQSAEERVNSERQLGQASSLNLDHGYTRENHLYGREERVPTRLAETVEAVLVRRDGEGFAPWVTGDWESGRVRLFAPALGHPWGEVYESPAYHTLRESPGLRFVLPIVVDDKGFFTSLRRFENGREKMVRHRVDAFFGVEKMI